MALDFDRLKAAIKDAAEKYQVEEYEIFSVENKSMSVETYQLSIKEFSGSVGGSLYLRCVWQGKMGYASTEWMETEEMEALMVRAIENAQISEKEEEAILYPGGSTYQEIPQHPFVMPQAAQLKQLALECQKVLCASDPMIADGTESDVYAEEQTMRLVNSKGLDLSSSAGVTGVYMSAVLDNGSEKQSDYEGKFNCLDTLDKEALAEKVVKKTKEKFDAKPVKTGKYTVIFDAKQMQNMLETFLPIFFAENVQKGLSLLKDRVGEKIASEKVTIIDTPFYEKNPMQIAFDGEGVPTFEKTVVENGTLKTLLYHLASARKDGVKSTGNASRSGASIGTGVYTFYLAPGTLSKEELIAKAGNGLYITETKGWHAGANAVTGDFSIESAGFCIENGVLTHPVKSFTIAGNFFELMQKIKEISCGWPDPKPGYTQILSPDVLVDNMSVAGE